MKEHPILFSAPMVRAILDGRKTQTRRIMKPQPIDVVGSRRRRMYRDEDFKKSWQTIPGCLEGDGFVDCPHGQPGDRLWVRERGVIDRSEHRFFAYHATPGVFKEATTGCVDERCSGQAQEQVGPGWKAVPSIHMPRWASRITLEITGVRVERLNDISERDAVAEGMGSPILRDCKVPKFAALWEQINGPGSWDANPWVWVVSFRRITNDAAMPANPSDHLPPKGGQVSRVVGRISESGDNHA